MKRVTKFCVVLALVVSGLCYCPKKAKADMFGVTDVSLLLQQIAQYVQDWDIGDLADTNFKELLSDLDKKAKRLDKILKFFDNAGEGVKTFRNVLELTSKLARTTKHIQSYISFLSRTANDFDLTRVGYIYKSFERRTQLILKDLDSVSKTMKKMEGEEGSKFLDTMDSYIQHANSLLDCVSNECISDLRDMIYDEQMREQADKSGEMSKLVIC